VKKELQQKQSEKSRGANTRIFQNKFDFPNVKGLANVRLYRQTLTIN
jgi:hypothetical protein